MLAKSPPMKYTPIFQEPLSHTAIKPKPSRIRSAPATLGIRSRQCLRLSRPASAMFLRKTRFGRTLRMLSSGGTVKSNVAKTPSAMPCKLNDQSHGTFGNSLKTR